MKRGKNIFGQSEILGDTTQKFTYLNHLQHNRMIGGGNFEAEIG